MPPARTLPFDTPSTLARHSMGCPRWIAGSIGLLIVLIFCLSSHLTAAEPVWKAGVSRAVITPEKPVWLAGYGSKRVPDGKLHELWMKALALEDLQGRRVVLITSDFQGVPRKMSDPAFALLRAKFGLERSH